MKKHLITSSLCCIMFVLLSGACNGYEKQDSLLPISLHLKVEKEYEQTYEKGFFLREIEQEQLFISTDSIKQKRYEIALEVKNTAQKPVSIWLMTCSWQDNILVNNNYMSMQSPGCDSNYPHQVILKPGESKLFKTTLVKSIKFDYPCKGCIYGPQVTTTKLGLILIDDIFENTLKPGFDYFLAMEDKSKWQIIWSNPLSL